MNWSKRYVRLSLPRQWMRDVVHFGSRSMVVGGSNSVRISAVAAARRNCQPLIGWNAILIRAIALTARKWPELRRSYIPFPWPHLYEHPKCVVTVVLEREWRGAHAVFFDQIVSPEDKSLREIEFELHGMRNAEVEAVGGFRRLIRITRYPLPLRRLIWRIVLSGSGRLKSRYVGTFSLNSLSSRRGRTTQSVTPVTMSIEYGAIQRNGELPLQVFVDHRVTDGASVNRICAELQAVLDRDIVDELNKGG
jgi:hypothetical protein